MLFKADKKSVNQGCTSTLGCKASLGLLCIANICKYTKILSHVLNLLYTKFIKMSGWFLLGVFNCRMPYAFKLNRVQNKFIISITQIKWNKKITVWCASTLNNARQSTTSLVLKRRLLATVQLNCLSLDAIVWPINILRIRLDAVNSFTEIYHLFRF